jgi:hypothetical protein
MLVMKTMRESAIDDGAVEEDGDAVEDVDDNNENYDDNPDDDNPDDDLATTTMM